MKELENWRLQVTVVGAHSLRDGGVMEEWMVAQPLSDLITGNLMDTVTGRRGQGRSTSSVEGGGKSEEGVTGLGKRTSGTTRAEMAIIWKGGDWS